MQETPGSIPRLGGSWRRAAAAQSLQSCPTLCDPIHSSPPGSPVPGIVQARTLEWVSTSFSSAWKWKAEVKSFSRVWLLATPWTAAYQASPEKGMATYSSILAWRIPRTEEPGWLPSMGSQRVRHDWSDLARTHAYQNITTDIFRWYNYECFSLFFLCTKNHFHNQPNITCWSYHTQHIIYDSLCRITSSLIKVDVIGNVKLLVAAICTCGG